MRPIISGMFDLVIRNGRILEGTETPWYRGDLTVSGGRIAAIGRIKERGAQEIEAEGLAVAPGFIDPHSHSDLMLISSPEARQKVMQGVTTEIVGQDGLGEAPIRDELVEDWRRYLSGLNGDPDVDWGWRSFGDYLDRLEAAGPSTNVASLVGHGNIRLMAMGMEDRSPRRSEMAEMRRLLDEAMQQGALGMSTGLIYPPCVYAETKELTELCKVVAAHRGVFVAHMRNEGDQLLESIDEVLKVGWRTGVPVHISHFKASGEGNWGRSTEALEKLEQGRGEEIDVTFDQYPYTAGSTFLSSLLPHWAHEGGTEKMLGRLMDPEIRARIADRMTDGDQGGRSPSWDKILVTSVKTGENKGLEGMSVEDIAEVRGREPAEAVLDLILEEENAATMVSFTMSEDDIRNIMRHPLQMVCTDGIVLGRPHPRAYGSFPRVLGRYVREGMLRLEEAVRKMTSLPAQRFGLLDRGVLRPGFKADITVFDPDKVIDTATYEDPIRYPEGIEYVVVNGVMTVEGGEHTGQRAGEVIRHRPQP